eukprot:CAMPEP_0168597444 /NCGR_PEP_ID=MMETSP0420-20121227/10682_1 /TAXON_ID=498008 /ORGANISM="Pessonella sp." /LENGTH=71 /DNA_ID=CAMNT_0008634325 /DNA_START=42 /DNA_END=253 /DNA_ORIENTATION=+
MNAEEWQQRILQCFTQGDAWTKQRFSQAKLTKVLEVDDIHKATFALALNQLLNDHKLSVLKSGDQLFFEFL